MKRHSIGAVHTQPVHASRLFGICACELLFPHALSPLPCCCRSRAVVVAAGFCVSRSGVRREQLDRATASSLCTKLSQHSRRAGIHHSHLLAAGKLPCNVMNATAGCGLARCSKPSQRLIAVVEAGAPGGTICGKSTQAAVVWLNKPRSCHHRLRARPHATQGAAPNAVASAQLFDSVRNTALAKHARTHLLLALMPRRHVLCIVCNLAIVRQLVVHGTGLQMLASVRAEVFVDRVCVDAIIRHEECTCWKRSIKRAAY